MYYWNKLWLDVFANYNPRLAEYLSKEGNLYSTDLWCKDTGMHVK